MGDKRVGWIAGEDLAAVAATVLADGPAAHAGQNYFLSTEVLNGVEVAAILSEALGRQIAPVLMTPSDMMAAFASGAAKPPAGMEENYAKSQLEWVAYRGSTAMITGASKGLDAAFAKELAGRGMNLVLVARSSNSAFQPLPHMATYAAAKAFVLHFSEALKFELRGRGVQVMAVCPGRDGDEFLRGCINQDEGRCVRQRRAGGPPYLAVVRSKNSVAYPGRFSVRVTIWLPRLLPRNVMVSAAASATGKMGLAT